MNWSTVICLLAMLPICASITCYQCSVGSGGCEPFNATGSGVSPTSASQAVCYKSTAAGLLTSRGGYASSSSCVASSVGGYGIYCCSTDYCNGALSNYLAPFLLGLTFLALFVKH
ncbi:hypothetical protein I4U23_004167 [Adineta vaga]|nr:hypothetical protein I4U23_004167 [Adineta vaga]